MEIRRIRAEDDAQMAAVIRTVMPEFGGSQEGRPGFAINDPEVDWMSKAYGGPRAAYYVVEEGGRVLGGGGIAPLEGGDGKTCELRKMYFLPEVRGKGAGKKLLGLCLTTAKELGYTTCYLETLTGMDTAQALYDRFGFKRLCAARPESGATGHFGCDRYYELDLQQFSGT
jgi:putative acetyltransferase